MAHKKTPKLLTKLAIVSAIAATLPLTTDTSIHADGIGIQQAVTTTVQQTANKTNNIVKKNNKQSHPAPKATDTESYGIYAETGEDFSPADDPILSILFSALIGTDLLALIELSIEKVSEKKANQAPMEERRNSYEAR